MGHLTNIVVSHDSLIALHIQLHNQLRNLIISGRWPYGVRIPSESELTEYLGISRSTVRLAMQMAEVEGLVERTRGRGTFVAYQVKSTSRLIAYITIDFNTDFQILILKGAESQARASGYRVIFSNAPDPAESLRILHALQNDNIAGILLWPMIGSDLTAYHEIKVPTVLVDRTIPGLNHVCVTSDNYTGARALIQHLIDLEHRDIAFLCHRQMHLLPVAERFRAYQDTLRAAGLTPFEPMLIAGSEEEIGATHILQAYDDSDMPLIQQIQSHVNRMKPTAIFAANDHIAVLAVRALRLLNLRIPDDISVAGFDDSDLTVYMDVPLTTVAQDTFEIGRRAAQLLIDQIEHGQPPIENQLVPTQLRVRESTAVPVTAKDTERR